MPISVRILPHRCLEHGRSPQFSDWGFSGCVNARSEAKKYGRLLGASARRKTAPCIRTEQSRFESEDSKNLKDSKGKDQVAEVPAPNHRSSPW
jgi:hypothetical protein